MKIEYLILNLVILIGPIIFSFDREVRYYHYWSKVFISIGIVMIPFLIWDSYVTGIHWQFNEIFTLPMRLFGLPLGEILFFITVPFACLFIWQIIVIRKKILFVNNEKYLYFIVIILCFAFIIFMLMSKIYTSIVCGSIALTIFFDRILKTYVLSQTRTYLYLAIITGLILIFNGYLTARPVVLYNSAFLTNFRIWTIPIEDFGYGYTLILLCTIIFEKIKQYSNA